MAAKMEMSLRYNAILRDYGSMAVKGRKFIKDLKEVPPEYVVIYQDSYISKLTDLETLFCDRYNPLHLVKFPPADEKLIVLVKDKTTGRMFAIDVEDENVTVEDFKRKLSATETRYKAYYLKLSMMKTGERLMEGQTLKECGLEKGKVDILEMERTRIGGGQGGGYPAFISVNLEGKPANGVGVPKCYSWETYGYGMNLSGVCSEPGCISKLTKSKEVILNMEYGRIRMKKGWSRFDCPACLISDEERKLFYQRRGLPVPPLPSLANPVPGPSTQMKLKQELDREELDEEEEVQRGLRVQGTFTPTGFLLTCGRAMFRFKKQGAKQSVETVSMAALGPINEYTSFECSTHGLATYDFIEITTVAKYSSPMSCIQCFRQITDEHKKVALPCQHYFHPLCITELGGKRKCPICSYSDSQYDFENTETEDSDDDDNGEMKVMRAIGIEVDKTNKTPRNLVNTALNWNYNFQLVGEYAHAAEIDPWTHEIDDCVYLRACEAKESQRAKRKEEMFMVTRSGKKMKKIQVNVK